MRCIPERLTGDDVCCVETQNTDLSSGEVHYDSKKGCMYKQQPQQRTRKSCKKIVSMFSAHMEPRGLHLPLVQDC